MTMLRKTLLGLALVATAAASVFDLPWQQEAEQEQNQVQKPLRGQAAQTVQAVAAQTAVPPATLVQSAPLREPFAVQRVNLFAPRSWLPPAPPQSKPEVPRAPPLPFRYLGKKIEGTEVQAFVGEGTNVHLLRKGSLISAYKVQDVSMTDMTLLYLPLNETQRLTFGSSN